jgi:hypothetical protein
MSAGGRRPNGEGLMSATRGTRHLLTLTLLVVALLGGLLPARPEAQPAPAGAQQLFFDGFELLRDGKFAEAAGKFEEGLRSEPDNALGHFFLAEAYAGLKQRDKARTHYRKSLDLDASSQVAEDARKRLAAQEPSKAETVDFINSKLSECKYLSAPINNEWKGTIQHDQSLKLAGETLGWSQHEDTTDMDPKKTKIPSWENRFEGSARVSELSQEVRVQEVAAGAPFRGTFRQILITCASGPCITVSATRRHTPHLAESWSQPVNDTKTYRQWSFGFCDTETAERLQRAFVHLIKTGGGKKSPF